MAKQDRLNKTYSVIVKTMAATGRAPHYTEIAAALRVPVEEGRQALHDLMGAGVPGCWLFPETDYIASFAPLSNLPTQYRISVDGDQKWYGQCGFESMAACWLFPGKTVRIDAPCLDCGQPVRVEMRDGRVLTEDPKGIVGYVAVPFARWLDRLPFS